MVVADKGIGILMLAVKKESGVSEVVHSVVTENKKVTTSGAKLFFLFIENDFYLIN